MQKVRPIVMMTADYLGIFALALWYVAPSGPGPAASPFGRCLIPESFSL